MNIKFVIKKFADSLAELQLVPEYWAGNYFGSYEQVKTFDSYAETELTSKVHEEGSYQIEKVFIKE
jgi:hypothetical protein